MDYVAIKNGVVVNLVVFNVIPDDLSSWEIDELVEIPSERPHLGWEYDGTTFKPPSL